MARYKNLYIDCGADFKEDFVIYDESGNALANTSGYTASGALRTYYDVTESTSFSASIVDGKLRLELSGDISDDLRGGTYVYDGFVVSDNQTIKVIEGKAFLTNNVTTL